MSDLDLGPETRKALRRLAAARAERERRAGQRLWAVSMLARTPEVAESIQRGLPVLARNLNGVVLRLALRGADLPPADKDNYIVVTADMLDAVNEAGPFRPTERRAAG